MFTCSYFGSDLLEIEMPFVFPFLLSYSFDWIFGLKYVFVSFNSDFDEVLLNPEVPKSETLNHSKNETPVQFLGI